MSNQINTVEDAMTLFYRATKSSKIKRSIARIVKHMSERPLEKRKLIIEQIASIMIRDYFSKTRNVRFDLRPRNIELGEALVEQVFNTGDIEFISDLFFRNNISDNSAMAFLGSRFFDYVGASIECTLQFCHMMFLFLAQNKSPEESPVADDSLKAQTRKRIIDMIISSACAPAIEACPQKKWINNIVEAAAKDNTDACECYRTVIYLYACSNRQTTSETVPKWVAITKQSDIDAICPDQQQQMDVTMPKDKNKPLRFVLPDNLVEKADIISSQIESRDSQQADETTLLLEWFQDNASVIGNKFDERCQAILERPRYGIRPMGFDSFLVNMSPLRSVGITSFSFYPEGELFPNMKILVTSRKLGCGHILCEDWLYFRNFELVAKEGMFRNVQGTSTTLLRNLLEYIVLHALHKIVIGKPGKNMDDADVERPEQLHEVVHTTRVNVRPFIRRLRLGFEASEEARQLAFLLMGWKLPAGMTFVRSHERWQGLPAGKPPPLFDYTDKAVRQSIE